MNPLCFMPSGFFLALLSKQFVHYSIWLPMLCSWFPHSVSFLAPLVLYSRIQALVWSSRESISYVWRPNHVPVTSSLDAAINFAAAKEASEFTYGRQQHTCNTKEDRIPSGSSHCT
jgi:hypothetical protein